MIVEINIPQPVIAIANLWGYTKYTLYIPIRLIVIPFYTLIRSLVSNLIFIPFKHAIHILCYTILYLPLSPLFYVLDIGFEMELEQFWEQAKFFSLNAIHFFLVACIFGTIVGVVTGLVLSLITFVFNGVEGWLLGSKVTDKNDNFARPLEAKSEISEIADIVSYPKVDSSTHSYASGINTNGTSESIYEDDDGYSGSYLIARGRNSKIKQEVDNYKIKQELEFKQEPNMNDIPTIKEEEQETLNNEVFSMNLRERLNTLNTHLTTPENSSKASSK